MKYLHTLILLLFLSLSSFSQPDNGLKIVKLLCNHTENPTVINNPVPNFSWQLQSALRNQSQSAYRILVADNIADLKNLQGKIWDSKKKVTDKSILVQYNGKRLNPAHKYFWKVKVWNQDGTESEWSDVGTFQTGLFSVTDWGNAKWIGYEEMPAELKLVPGGHGNGNDQGQKALQRPVVPLFRKCFVVKKNISSATLFMSGLGQYEAFVNGAKVSDSFLAPGWTDYDKTVFYNVYDVTKMVDTGENSIGAIVGNGFYNINRERYRKLVIAYGMPKMFCRLQIQYTDGTNDNIVSDDSWKTSPSPVTYTSIYGGEDYDARLEQLGWDKASFKDSKWGKASCTGAPSQNIIAQALHPIRNVEEIPAKKMVQQDARTFLFNFGRNISGVSQITVSGATDTTIRLKHGERLGKDGRVDQSNIDVHYRPTDDTDPFQTDIFILNGKSQETFMPRFNYKGFQYVEVIADNPIKLTKESLTAYFMHSDVPAAGSIRSSNPTLNKIWQAANASYLSNLFGYPTDCPQREKNGWTGDAQINIETGLYNFDAITIYEKWMADHQDEQQPNGVLPAIIPTDGWGYQWANGPDWTSTIAIIPWNIYLFYGNSHLLESCYGNIKRYVDHIDEISPSGLTDWGLGDWVPVKSETPKEFTSSTYFYIDATILAKAAKILGKEADYEKYSALTGKIKSTINTKYLNTET